jgi:hypothetical protein
LHDQKAAYGGDIGGGGSNFGQHGARLEALRKDDEHVTDTKVVINHGLL